MKLIITLLVAIIAAALATIAALRTYPFLIPFLVPGSSPIMHHSSISVKDYPQSMAFYDATFKELGYKRVMTIDIKDVVQCAGYGPHKFAPGFWISPMGNPKEQVGNARGVHFAFLAPNRKAVDAWYKKCLELGGSDNGKPGLRPEYHANYYGAFVIDPSGWRIEACCHAPE